MIVSSISWPTAKPNFFPVQYVRPCSNKNTASKDTSGAGIKMKNLNILTLDQQRTALFSRVWIRLYRPQRPNRSWHIILMSFPNRTLKVVLSFRLWISRGHYLLLTPVFLSGQGGKNHWTLKALVPTNILFILNAVNLVWISRWHFILPMPTWGNDLQTLKALTLIILNV